jgi:tetratricopeptide (TPR) repeat protein
LSKDFAGQLSIAVIGQALSEANIASQQGRASIPQLQQVGRRIEALLRRIESPEVTLGYAGVLARIGEQIGDRSLSERAIDMSVELLKSKAEFLDEETIYRVNSNIASMLLTLAYNNRDRSFLDRAMSYLTLARDMRAGKRPDINYGILMSMLGERELRHDYIELSINEFSEILSDNSGHFAEETIGKAWHNLGMANTVLYKITSNRDALDAGIAAFELALEFRRENDDPLYWAKTHDALGGTFFARGTALNNSEDVRCALPHFEAARDVYRRESMDHRVAEITYNFGCALACAAALDGSENDLLSAIAELRESEEFWKPERNGKWASAQNALGSAHINLAIMFSDAGAAEIGAECFQNAQLNLDPVSDLEAWVGVRNNEGRCLTVSGVLRGELQPLIEARTRLEECAQAIEPFPKHPLVRMVRHNLSDCYVKLSVLDGDHEYLELAIALHREAAAANGPGDDFELWSQELAEMVSLLLILAEVTNRAEPLQKARASLTKLIKECGERYEAEAYPAVCAVAETLLEQVGFAQQRLEA